MTINLETSYSILDKRKEFFLECDTHHHFNQWVWFYLGRYMPDGVSLHPYKWHETKLLKSYTNPIDAEIVAKKIVKRIKKELEK